MDRIKNKIFTFISKHEAIIANEMSENGISARFTTFGNRAGCKALYEVIMSLDDDTQKKVVELMKK